MKIKKLELKNFRGIDQATFDLSSKLNLFVGLNGSGKSTILDAIVISLSWLVNRIQKENTNGKLIGERNIKNGSTSSSINALFENNKSNYEWTIATSARGYNNDEKSDLLGVSRLASEVQEKYKSKKILPVIAYYPINRVVNNSSPFLFRREMLSAIDVYNNALGGKANYSSFFEWFRLQEDIVNEEANSRSKWLSTNKTWIKNRATKLVDALVNELTFDDSRDEDMVKSIKKRSLGKDLLVDPRFFL